ncbi:MAG: hypothetical protein AB7V50_05900 [Vampirovibrionia bacterium]
MKKPEYFVSFALLFLMTGVLLPVYADNYDYAKDKSTMINETETTGAFGSNEAFTLNEDDITDEILNEDLTDKVINEVEQKLESGSK